LGSQAARFCQGVEFVEGDTGHQSDEEGEDPAAQIDNDDDQRDAPGSNAQAGGQGFLSAHIFNNVKLFST